MRACSRVQSIDSWRRTLSARWDPLIDLAWESRSKRTCFGLSAIGHVLARGWTRFKLQIAWRFVPIYYLKDVQFHLTIIAISGCRTDYCDHPIDRYFLQSDLKASRITLTLNLLQADDSHLRGTFDPCMIFYINRIIPFIIISFCCIYNIVHRKRRNEFVNVRIPIGRRWNDEARHIV